MDPAITAEPHSGGTRACTVAPIRWCGEREREAFAQWPKCAPTAVEPQPCDLPDKCTSLIQLCESGERGQEHQRVVSASADRVRHDSSPFCYAAFFSTRRRKSWPSSQKKSFTLSSVFTKPGQLFLGTSQDKWHPQLRGGHLAAVRGMPEDKFSNDALQPSSCRVDAHQAQNKETQSPKLRPSSVPSAHSRFNDSEPRVLRGFTVVTKLNSGEKSLPSGCLPPAFPSSTSGAMMW